MGTLAVSGASGKTGWRVVSEALREGRAVRALVRPGSVLPPALAAAQEEGRLEVVRLPLAERESLHRALEGCDALVIATGARPSVNLRGRCRWMPSACASRSRPARRWGCGGWCW